MAQTTNPGWFLLYIDFFHFLEQNDPTMSHLEHIRENKKILEARFSILKSIRNFFDQESFIEVESPLIIKLPGQEPNLSPVEVNLCNERKQIFPGFLHTSPEYTMKKMLAAGFEKIFFLGKCFRNEESFGGTHNPEFTMLEWYRTGADLEKIMDDVENLFNFVGEKIHEQKFISEKPVFHFERMSMKDLWQECVQVNLDDYLDRESLFKLCQSKNYNPSADENYETLFYRIFLNEIEPKLKNRNIIIYNYPAVMASLSRVAINAPGYAERFEAYIDGVEICNAFGELTDGQEQKKRLLEEKAERQRQGKRVFAIDEEFISALDKMPASSGIALGVDRMIMVLLACQNINNVITLPASELFSE